MQYVRDFIEQFSGYVSSLDAGVMDMLRDIMLRVGPPYSGNYVFADPRQPNEPLTYNKQLNLWNIVKRPGIKRILEIGFNAGHSTAMCLMAKPDTTVLAFDIAEFAYTIPCAKFLAEKFPGRFKLVVGDSKNTVPSVDRGTFDLIHIDGCHTYDHVLADLHNTLKMCHADTVVLVDDYHGGIREAVEECIEQGLLKVHPDIELLPMPAWAHAVFQPILQ